MIRSDTVSNLMEVFSKFNRIKWNGTSAVGLKHSEVVILYCIKQAVNSDSPGVMVSEISTSLKVTPPTVTQLVKSLEDNGYLLRSMDPNDRRAVRINLTEKGEEVLATAMDEMYTLFEGLITFLGEENSIELTNLLSRVFCYFNEIKVDGR